MEPCLADIIMLLHPELDPMKDFRLQDDSDGKGAYIVQWNVPSIPQPTVEELLAQKDTVMVDFQNKQADLARVVDYPALSDQVGALVKQMADLSSAGTVTLIPEMQEVVDQVQAVKLDNPKAV